MRWLFLVCGAVATSAMIAISMRLNFLFGYGLGQTPEKALVFGWVSVVADAWKALAPVFVVTLARDRRLPSAAAASVVWCACFVFSVSSALGIAIQDRSSITNAREALRTSHDEARSEIAELDSKRGGLSPHRSVGEVEAAIAGLLAQPAGNRQGLRGNVASLSANCTKADARTVATCAEVAVLRRELAVAAESSRLEQRLTELRRRVSALRERGVGPAPDPQAELLARVMRGWVSARDVGPGLALLLACVVELVSAFGPVVIAAYADVTKRTNGRQVDGQAAMAEYLLERIEPGDQDSRIAADALYADYRRWCAAKKRTALGHAAFTIEFDRSCFELRLDQIQKLGDWYYGIRIAG